MSKSSWKWEEHAGDRVLVDCLDPQRLVLVRLVWEDKRRLWIARLRCRAVPEPDIDGKLIDLGDVVFESGSSFRPMKERIVEELKARTVAYRLGERFPLWDWNS